MSINLNITKAMLIFSILTEQKTFQYDCDYFEIHLVWQI